MRAVAILTAAGSGTRLGHALPKALVPLAGIPLVLVGCWFAAGAGRKAASPPAAPEDGEPTAEELVAPVP